MLFVLFELSCSRTSLDFSKIRQRAAVNCIHKGCHNGRFFSAFSEGDLASIIPHMISIWFPLALCGEDVALVRDFFFPLPAFVSVFLWLPFSLMQQDEVCVWKEKNDNSVMPPASVGIQSRGEERTKDTFIIRFLSFSASICGFMLRCFCHINKPSNTLSHANGQISRPELKIAIFSKV